MAEADQSRPSDAQPPAAGDAVIRPTSMPLPRPRPAWQPVVGIALAVPALIFLITSYLEPTVWAVRTSTRTLEILQGAATAQDGERTAAAVGLRYYRLIFAEGFGGALGFALSLAVVPMLVVLVVGPALAWAAARAGDRVRRIIRAVLVLPVVCFAPVAIAVAWRIDRAADADAVHGAAGLVREVAWFGTAGLVCALAVTWYLAALRRVDPYRAPAAALVVAALLAGAATLAVALQAFTFPYVLAGSGRRTDTPLIAMLSTSVVPARFGPAAAIATILVGILAVLGLAAAVLIIITGLRLEVDTGRPATTEATRAAAGRRPAGWVAAALAVTVLVISLYAFVPWLRHAMSSGHPAGTTAGQVLVNTWVPPLVSTLIGVGAAALAGFGIGALRPFGRSSELLLLPFAPYLFVGIGPLALRAYAAGATADRMDGLLGLVPPTRLEVPALFLFTMLFRGQAVRAQQHRQLGGLPLSWWRGYIRPALPMIGIVGLATWVVRAQDLLWPVLSGSGRHATGPVLLAAQLRTMGAGSGGAGTDGAASGAPGYALAMPPWVLLLLLLIGVVAQLMYLDRVALRLGRPEYPGGPRT